MSDGSTSVFLSNNLAVNPGGGGRAWSSNCFNFVSTPAILFDCVSAHPVLHPGGGQCLVRVVTGCLVGTLEGDIQQVLLVPTKVNFTWYSTSPTLRVLN